METMRRVLLAALAVALAASAPSAPPTPTDAPKMCEEAAGASALGGGDAGNILPLFGVSEQRWPKGLRAFLYLVGLLWSFVGVAIIADVFMAAIERITSSTKYVKGPNGRPFEVKVWNDTVANLTLMALGSSAPEILLSMIEIAANDMMSGDLGPSTIVGSASFNLMAITAVCIVSVPVGETRRIHDMPVFVVTAISSVFAYLWLIIILMGSSPDVVSLEEALITFLFFPLLVVLSYGAEKGWFASMMPASANKVEPAGKHTQKVTVRTSEGPQTADDISHAIKQARRAEGAGTGEELEAATMKYAMVHKKRSRAEYRIGAIRNLFGGKQVGVYKNPVQPSQLPKLKEEIVDDAHANEVKAAEKHVEFTANTWSVIEKAKHIELMVKRWGPTDEPVEVKYVTADGTANAGKDYKASTGLLKFAKGEAEQKFTIEIIDDDEFEPDEFFTVTLSEPSAGTVGHVGSTRVIIIDDDFPGVIGFENGFYRVKEDEGVLKVNVVRRNGCAGKVSVKFATQDATAIAGKDYEAVEETVVFEPGETSKPVAVKIIDDCKYEEEEYFKIELTDATGGATISDEHGSSKDRDAVRVMIACDDKVAGLAARIRAMMNSDKMAIGTSAWSEQFTIAIDPAGGEDFEVNTMGWIMHCIALPWKLVFALVPPTSFCNGWLCFYVALMFIAVLTAFIGDLASLLGCVLGIPDAITAITFVALGTSLPDTFASQQATICNAHADASITNITGSNSVNVFLGLGLPWLMAAIYWAVEDCKINPGSDNLGSDACIKWRGKYEDEDYPFGFIVPAGDLGFSTGVFTGCAICTLGLLVYRRYAKGIQAELGGPRDSAKRHAAIMVSLWLLFVALASWQFAKSA